jgi:hypothetical protein
MTVEQRFDDGAARPTSPLGSLPGPEPVACVRPNVSGDLPSVLEPAPMFRRAVLGYDRFQVDTYVRWAEDELAAADREHEHLVGRHLRTQAALDESRQLLSHSPGGGEFLQFSRRIGSMLAAAADEAAGIHAEAEGHRRAATAQANRRLGYARWRIAYAEARATDVVAAAARQVEEMTTEAERIVEQARQTGREARAEAEALRREVRAIEQRAVEDAGRVRQRAADEAAAARLQARDEVVRMLLTGREQRERADAESAAARERLDRHAAARRAALLGEVEALERRRAALRAEVELQVEPHAGTPGSRFDLHPRRLRGRLRLPSRHLRAS